MIYLAMNLFVVNNLDEKISTNCFIKSELSQYIKSQNFSEGIIKNYIVWTEFLSEKGTSTNDKGVYPPKLLHEFSG